jgi:hypothetical protein
MPDGSFQKLRIPPDRLTITWYHLRDHIPYKRTGNHHREGEERCDPRRCTKRSPQQLATLKHELSKIASSIHRGIFPRNPSYATCGVCPYADICVQDSMGKALNRNQQRQVKELMEEVNAAQV